MPLSCPKCHVKMRPYDIEGIEVDRCKHCGGIWLDKNELEQIMNKEVASYVDIHTHGKTKEEIDNAPAYCFRCDHSMMTIDGANDIKFEWCMTCESTFFDKGELSAINDFAAD